ncbi:hypothetical protein ACJ72_07849 [Emergomyces africanus]|uniref:Uncharacterized protein n=1 Tax=Emergomyces africanus TaxID=1955775 RepID=A0A1B7NMJ4_9EURO|nr:hypothetical protein ACJ72_07849 [Emergomyces africanus]
MYFQNILGSTNKPKVSSAPALQNLLDEPLTNLKLLYKRVPSYTYNSPDSSSIRSTGRRAKARATSVALQSWLNRKLSNRKVDEEATDESSLCASQHTSHPPSSSYLETPGHANGSSTRLSTRGNDALSGPEGEGLVTRSLAPVIEASSSPVIELNKNILDAGNEDEDDDTEQTARSTPPDSEADRIDIILLPEQSRHAIDIATLEEEYKGRIKALVEEKMECMEHLKYLTEQRDAFTQQKEWWQARFVTITRSQTAQIDGLQKELKCSERSQRDAEARCKNLESLVQHRQVQLGIMQKELAKSESELEKVSYELQGGYHEISLLREQIRYLEDSSIKHFRVYRVLGQYKLEYQNLRTRYQTLEQQVAEAKTSTLQAIAELERAKTIKSELEAGLNPAEASRIQTSAVEGLQTDLTFSKPSLLEAEEPEVFPKYRPSTLEEEEEEELLA